MTAIAIIAVSCDPLGAGQALRPFLGQPALERPIAVARAAGLFDRVIVVTNDPATAAVAVRTGVEAVAPPCPGDDPAAIVRAMLPALDLSPDALLALIHPGALLLRVDDLRAGWAQLRNGGAEAVLAVASYPAPVQRALRIDGDRVRMMRQENLFLRSQDLTEACNDARQFQLRRTAAWRVDGPTATLPFQVPRHLVPVLATDADWMRAEILAQVLAEAGE
jgi:CMP-N-acetylneuraminic acid synthetase